MLDGIDQNKDDDIQLSNPICSATTPVVKIEPDIKRFNHVFIGNVLYNNNNIFFYSANIQFGKNLFSALS